MGLGVVQVKITAFGQGQGHKPKSNGSAPILVFFCHGGLNYCGPLKFNGISVGLIYKREAARLSHCALVFPLQLSTPPSERGLLGSTTAAKETAEWTQCFMGIILIHRLWHIKSCCKSHLAHTPFQTAASVSTMTTLGRALLSHAEQCILEVRLVHSRHLLV